MKSKFLLFLTGLFAVAAMFGTTYSAWTFTNDANITNNVQVEVPSWDFLADSDFAVYDNIRSVTNLVASKESTITAGSAEAIRLTSTTGTSTKDHTVNINLDRDYYLSEIQFFKFEFDYHHRYKREQYNKGFPTVQFTINNSTLGTNQGGTDYCTAKSPFVATEIDENWWHLEYFIFAHMPTIAKGKDTPIATTKKINGVRITDRTMYDYAGTTAYVVIDNMQFSAEPTSRLGIFNRWTSDVVGNLFWFKVAWSSEIHSVKLYSSDTSIAVPEFDPSDIVSTSYPFPNGSPFYVQFLKAGTVTITAVLELGDNHEIQTISYTYIVTDP
jgi:hypothetical protein